MKRKIIFSALLVATFLTCSVGVRQAQGIQWFFDKKLTLSGNIRETAFIRRDIPREENLYHESNLDYLRTGMLMEALYKIKDEQDFQINFFGGVQWHYEAINSIDEKHKRGMPHRAYKDYKTPIDEDYITEAYLDFMPGPWQVRIGKQIVIWGETGIQRTADLVNPLDLRLGTPGVDDWETIKLGVWMIRTFYQSQLPGGLLFEIIFVPGDYRQMRLPVEGGHFGPAPQTSFNPGKGFGITHWLFEKARRDAPGWSLRDNWELGFRLRGYTWDVDWTLMYYNSMSDYPVAYPDEINALAMQYVAAALRSGYTNETINPGDWPGYRAYRTARQTSIGGTAQTMIEFLDDTVWRIEWVYAFGQYTNKSDDGTTGGTYTDIVKRDSFAIGLNVDNKYTIPYFTHNWFDDSKVSISLTLFYEKIFNHDDELVYPGSRNKRVGDSHAHTITWSIQQFFWHYKGMVIVVGSFVPATNKYFVAPIFAYIPDDHWRFEFAPIVYGPRGRNDSARKDSLLLRVRYEW